MHVNVLIARMPGQAEAAGPLIIRNGLHFCAHGPAAPHDSISLAPAGLLIGSFLSVFVYRQAAGTGGAVAGRQFGSGRQQAGVWADGPGGRKDAEVAKLYGSGEIILTAGKGPSGNRPRGNYHWDPRLARCPKIFESLERVPVVIAPGAITTGTFGWPDAPNSWGGSQW
jgi:hypothetical protein